MKLMQNHESGTNMLRSVQEYCYYLFAATFCLNMVVGHVFLIIALTCSLLLWKPAIFKNNFRAFLLISLIYFVSLASAFYSSNKKEAWFVLEKQMTMLLIPFLMAGTSHGKLSLAGLLRCFSYAVSLACVWLLYQLYHSYTALNGGTSLADFLHGHLHHSFSEPLNLHATFLSIYVCFSIAVMLYDAYHAKNWYRGLAMVALPLLVISMLFLSSRIILLPFAIILVVVLPFFLRRFALLLHLITVALLFLLAVFYVGNFSAFRERFADDTLRELNITGHEKLEFRLDTINTNDATRAERWQCAIKLIQEKPLFGYGTGDEKAMLNVMYHKYRLSNSISNNFDSHNQYFAFTIKSGVVGLTAFVLALLFGFYRALRTKSFHFLSFMVIITITALTENILESNKGILFYALFMSAFVFLPPVSLQDQAPPADS